MTGCGRDGFADRTAVITTGGRSTTYTVDSCGLDGDTVFLVGRAPDRSVVQAVIASEGEGEVVALEISGLTFGTVDETWAAFGPDAWTRRQGPGSAPGGLDSGWVRGSRVQVDGTAERLDRHDRVLERSDDAGFTLEARCDELDDT